VKCFGWLDGKTRMSLSGFEMIFILLSRLFVTDLDDTGSVAFRVAVNHFHTFYSVTVCN